MRVATVYSFNAGQKNKKEKTGIPFKEAHSGHSNVVCIGIMRDRHRQEEAEPDGLT